MIIKAGTCIFGPYEIEGVTFDGKKRIFLLVNGEVYDDFFIDNYEEGIARCERVLAKASEMKLKKGQ